MNKHFAVVNKKAAVLMTILLIILMALFSVSFSYFMGGGSKLWLVGVIVFASIFLLTLLGFITILKSGIDVKEGIVIMPDIDPSKGIRPQFKIEELDTIEIRNCDGKVLDLYTDNLFGARFVFILKDGHEVVYYPVSVTKKQCENVMSMLELI